MEGVDEDFPHLLGRRMEELGIRSGEELADRIGCTQGAVSKWMSYLRAPTRKNYQRIADAIETSVDAVATAVARTTIVKPSPLAAQLSACQQERDVLRAENERLRLRLALQSPEER